MREKALKGIQVLRGKGLSGSNRKDDRKPGALTKDAADSDFSIVLLYDRLGP